MSFDSTLLYKEAERVRDAGEGYHNVRTTVNILANGKWTQPNRVEHIHLVRDYSTGPLGDVRQLEVLMLLGDYTFDILPYRDNLTIDITEIPLMEGNSARNWERFAGTKRYKAILDLEGGDNTVLTNKQSAMTNKAQMNQVGMKSVVFTLVDEICYKLMMVTTGLTFRQMTSLDMIQYVHKLYFDQLFEGSSERIEGINVWRDQANPAVIHQLALPDGIPLKDVCRFIQNDECGVYPTGLGRYIQNKQFYVYPLFDTTRYSKNSKVLNIINMPNDRFKGSEKTFLDNDRSLTIIVTGTSIANDKSTGTKIQDGNGFRFGDLNKLLNTGTIKDNRMLIDRATNLFEVTSETLADGLNNMRWSADRFTANPFKQYTTMAQQQGQPVTVQWTRGNADLLEPGMPVKFQTIDGATVNTYYGTLLGVNDNRAPVDSGNINTRFDGITTLSLFLVRQTETAEANAV
ncbi:virion structural protein [Pseudomonas phage 201phi2-1]|uniref:Virion structural protein n=1 Tax=Pseudomonas phage 201phi2-1 TaxID=198110 RepID=B3FJ27_BP201|nr:virion structural protein [Pseudomonas phage 201phi2-1]ABY62994.1 virion structural protein [Pseudomonas phage 201phi2-1]